MAYSAQVLRRARARLEQAKLERERENEAHRAAAYERYPRLREIDRELQQSMAELAIAFLKKDSEETLGAIRTRNQTLQAERNWILEAGEFEDGYLDDTPVCTRCGGTGYDGSQMCSCLRELCRQEQKKELTSLLGSGRESFDTFRLDVYSDAYDPKLGTSPRELMRSNLNICKKYAAGFSAASGSLLFSGATGLGKTFLSACIARQIADRGFSVIYETAIRLFGDFETEKFGAQGGDGSLTRKYFDCDLLIIDDLGTELTTEFVRSAFYQIVNTRLMTNKKTIISTNLSPAELSRRYGANILSRIEGAYRILPFFGDDIRKQKK